MPTSSSIPPLLRPYVPIARLIVETIGPTCEVVLHDLSVPQHSVVHVENGVVTGRRLGESFEHIVKELIKRRDAEGDIIANYAFEHEGRRIRSSTLLIRDAKDALAGALCINLDVSWAAQAAEAAKLLGAWAAGPAGSGSGGAAAAPAQSTAKRAVVIDRSVSEITDQLIDRIVEETAAAQPGRTLTREARLSALAFMASRGVFLVKGAVERAADRLRVSKVTVYADLDELRRRSQDA